MAVILAPSARYMIVCDDVLKDERAPNKLSILGLTARVAWPADQTMPLRLDQLVVLLVLTDGRGSGMGWVECRDEVLDVPIFASPATFISFEGKDPTGLYGLTFTLRDCVFPAPGAYVIQFHFGDGMVREQVIIVR